MLPRLATACLLGALLSAIPLWAGTLSVVGPNRWVHVAYVYDGDTFRASDGTRVRLLGINAPEVAHRDTPAQPLARKARLRLVALIGDREVRLETDAVRHDVYGRLLAHVYRRDGTWVDGLLVREGLAHAYIFPPNFRHAAALIRDEETARAGHLGIWATRRFRVLPVAELSPNQIGRFRLVTGAVTHVARNGLAFRMGRLHVSIPRAYRRYFPARLALAAGARVCVHGVLRLSDRGRLYLALHSPFDLSKIIRP